jgi:arsenate reductase (thioredoxin)
MEERGLDLSGQHAKGLSRLPRQVHLGYLVNICHRAEPECPKTFPSMGTRLDWAFDDPATLEGRDEQRLAKFREVRDAIAQRIQAWLGGHAARG